MVKSKRSRATDFTFDAKQQIVIRDKGKCIFCELQYRTKEEDLSTRIKDFMHYIPRSAGGLGIPENAALGCRYHHNMYDNGNLGVHDEMRMLFREYLAEHHFKWDESKLVYNKWDFLVGGIQ